MNHRLKTGLIIAQETWKCLRASFESMRYPTILYWRVL